MELKDFVYETITQIADGVKMAQEKAGNAYRVSPRHLASETRNSKDHKEFNGDTLEVLDFDVAITTKDRIEGDAGAKIIIAKADLSGSLEHEHLSRVRFQVYVQWPRHQ